MEVVIFGAGVTGVSLAYHLSKKKIKCTILEKEAVAASHASGKNAGMLRQLYHNSQLTEWAYKSINEMPANLKEQYFTQTGSIIIGRKIPGHHQELFTEENNSVRCKTDGLLDSGSYVQALLSLAKSKGAKCNFNNEVLAVEKKDQKWLILTNSKQKYQADLIVNASGAWVNKIVGIPNRLSVKAYARHLAVVSGFPEGFMPAENCGFYWDENDSWYMRKWDKNSRLVSVCDQVACEPEVEPNSINVKESIAEKLFKHIPELANNLAISHYWHCYRTYNENRLPIIGFDQNDSSFFWLSGFGGFGMSTSYAATFDAARLIIGEECSELKHFSPERCNI